MLARTRCAGIAALLLVGGVVCACSTSGSNTADGGAPLADGSVPRDALSQTGDAGLRADGPGGSRADGAVSPPRDRGATSDARRPSDLGPAGTTPQAVFVPKPSGTCPSFAAGLNAFTAGGRARQAKVWISSAATQLDGPLVFYWHSSGGTPDEAAYALGAGPMKELTDKGGIVVAPVRDPASQPFPWYLVRGTADHDLRLADEILACAVQRVGVDLRRVHSIGMSAGAVMTTQMSWRRSGYLASVATYSGGQEATPPNQDPSNLFAALVFHGGPTDTFGSYSFQALSTTYHGALVSAGHFAAICNHGNGHVLPPNAGTLTLTFLLAHPFGTRPSPYAKGLPAPFPGYCTR
ncbi:MAG: hypothetical protein IT371_29925 [Deltaproteobacteria bacterium]|nr:hypothetical protein [Deltaproteobacteria bacterium]